MTPENETAVQEIQASFLAHIIDVEPEDQGGAYVTVGGLSLGDSYLPTETWVGFLITFQYPRADVYPHFIDASVKRVDCKPHVPGISGPVTWRGRSALQVSRKSPRWDGAIDTAVAKLHKILSWLRSQ
jgi:hypothetical protein